MMSATSGSGKLPKRTLDDDPEQVEAQSNNNTAAAIKKPSASGSGKMKGVVTERPDLQELEQNKFIYEQAMAANELATSKNGLVVRPEDPLYPLHSLWTNEPIPGFPKTKLEVGTTPDEEVDRILDALNMKWTPNPDVTRQHCLAVVTGTPLNVPYYPYPT